MATTQQQKEFINRMWDAVAGLELHGLLPSVLIAQAALESNWGKSSLAAKYNNYFGIKAGSSWKGKTVTMSTREVVNGISVTKDSVFRAYDSPAESIADRNKLLLNNKRYKEVAKAKTAQEQAQAIRSAGYATATNYVTSIMNIVNSHNLTELDEKKKQIMNTKTISIIILAMGAMLAGVGLYNIIKL